MERIYDAIFQTYEMIQITPSISSNAKYKPKRSKVLKNKKQKKRKKG